MSLSKRAGLTAASALMSLGALAGLSAMPASAHAQTTPAAATTASHCTRDVCVRVESITGNKLTIRAWARSAPFYGHFELLTAAGATRNSPTGTWHAGGRGWTFTNIEYRSGNYVATGWESKGGGSYEDVGKVIFQA